MWGVKNMDDLNYPDIVRRLKESFPKGTVKLRSDTQKAYIPNQIYTDRLEAATEGQWSKTIKDIEINLEQQYVKVIVSISISDYSRDGFGFAYIDKDGQGRPKVSNALDQAAASAFVEAVDSWQMGWSDLAPYKDWGDNPALRHLIGSNPAPEGQKRVVHSNSRIERNCIMAGCGKPLSADEWELLKQVPNLNRDRMIYCFDHLPEHLKRKIPDKEMKAFLQSQE